MREYHYLTDEQYKWISKQSLVQSSATFEPARFKGDSLGVELMRYLGMNTKYPSMALSLGEKGISRVFVHLDAEGKVVEAAVAKSAHPYIDSEAWRVLSIMPQWQPATLDGKPVESYQILPVRFTLR